mmetsp:Transcript_58372/g.127689  ORF Transcript_58372/g.127689 Transcript_58372/m.127689 type:complete len:208 (+) Transcript_58372:1919-2542(+)
MSSFKVKRSTCPTEPALKAFSYSNSSIRRTFLRIPGRNTSGSCSDKYCIVPFMSLEGFAFCVSFSLLRMKSSFTRSGRMARFWDTLGMRPPTSKIWSSTSLAHTDLISRSSVFPAASKTSQSLEIAPISTVVRSIMVSIFSLSYSWSCLTPVDFFPVHQLYPLLSHLVTVTLDLSMSMTYLALFRPPIAPESDENIERKVILPSLPF